MELAPIVLFVYNRPWHTQQTIEALQKNNLANESNLIIYSDSPKNMAAKESVNQVRSYIKIITGFKKITIIERNRNWGLANSIIDGVTSVVNEYGNIIVLEDDLVTSPFFLSFMNDSLELYKTKKSVISIHGYTYPVEGSLPTTFFLRGADCWGWATWKRGWDIFESDGEKLLRELSANKLSYLFDYGSSYPYTKMLKDQIKGNNDSWAIRWYASAFLSNKLTLYSGVSLVHNIGNDSSGTHCTTTDEFSGFIKDSMIEAEEIMIEENSLARNLIINFHKKNKTTLPLKVLRKITSILKQWLPPILKTQLNAILKRNINYFGKFKEWSEASDCTSGYDSSLILQQVKQATLKVKNGEALFERDSVVFDEIQYSFPVLAGLFRAAVENKNQLSVLDFGGSLGSSYFQCQDFLSVLSTLEWNIVEQEHFVKCGLEHFSSKELHFYYTINECLVESKPSVILLSSVLQYLSDPFLILDELMRVGAPYIIIDRTPFSNSATDFVTVQHVPASIYKASYPCWIFSRQSFLTRLTEKYQILTEFESDDNYACVGKLKFKFGGMVLRKL